MSKNRTENRMKNGTENRTENQKSTKIKFEKNFRTPLFSEKTQKMKKMHFLQFFEFQKIGLKKTF